MATAINLISNKPNKLWDAERKGGVEMEKKIGQKNFTSEGNLQGKKGGGTVVTGRTKSLELEERIGKNQLQRTPVFRFLRSLRQGGRV